MNDERSTMTAICQVKLYDDWGNEQWAYIDVASIVSIRRSLTPDGWERAIVMYTGGYSEQFDRIARADLDRLLMHWDRWKNPDVTQ